MGHANMRKTETQTMFDLTDHPHLLDIFGFLVSSAMFLGYLKYMQKKLRHDPASTIQGITMIARAAWVERVMEEGKDILAVQTLRNSTMAATFMASTAILLTVGVLTLTGQADKLGITWRSINLWGSTHQSILAVKLVILLVNLFAAFFCFSTSVRLYNHVGYMINAPHSGGRKVMSAGLVAAQLNRAGHYYSVGMRGFYCMVPLVLWIFGPVFLVGSTTAMLVLLHRLDRTPIGWELDYRASCNLPPPPSAPSGK